MPEVWNNLSFNYERYETHIHRPQVVLPLYQGQKGHPVLLSFEFQKKLLGIQLTDPDARLDLQIQKLSHDSIILVETEDPQVRMNLNTPKMWKNYEYANFTTSCAI
jgi:hypothetical protein